MTTLNDYIAADCNRLAEALDNSQSLLVAILNERRPTEEIEKQIAENREALQPGFFNQQLKDSQ